VHCTKILPGSNVTVKGQGHRGQKTKKCGILFGSRHLGHSPRAAFFPAWSMAVQSSASFMPVGKSAQSV